MKTLIALLIIIISIPSYALRCGNILVNEGSPYYQIIKNCNVVHEYQVNSSRSDIRKIYIDDSGISYQLTIIDGTLHDIRRM